MYSRKIALFAAVAAALVALAASSPAYATQRVHGASARFLTLANQGIRDARTHWWNPGERWYNDRLNDGDRYPLATVWSIVPLFEAVDGAAIADPAKAKRKAVRSFANFAERYWNGDLQPHGGYAPYPGDRGADDHVWFDDNSWWGLAFVDAFRATHNRRYLGDAQRASDFVDARGWQGGSGGMWWETQYTGHSLEALGAASALAAEVYEQGGSAKYRRRALKYIRWADRNTTQGDPSQPGFGLYENSAQPIMTYVEGAMLGAHLALCRKGDQGACERAEEIADSSRSWWPDTLPNFAPQYDTIFFRYLIQLAAYDHNPQWWDWARQNADAARRNARDNSLYLRFWDGSSVTAGQHASLQMRYGQIQTHGAAVALFAWLGAVQRP